ncbi:unnamed protein product [Closterium sp. Naga37s-1]|nr:unnamed protein product [Closterium sp. Naga37s-1]
MAEILLLEVRQKMARERRKGGGGEAGGKEDAVPGGGDGGVGGGAQGAGDAVGARYAGDAGCSYGMKADVWSMGITLCSMLTGRLPIVKPGKLLAMLHAQQQQLEQQQQQQQQQHVEWQQQWQQQQKQQWQRRGGGVGEEVGKQQGEQRSWQMWPGQYQFSQQTALHEGEQQMKHCYHQQQQHVMASQSQNGQTQATYAPMAHAAHSYTGGGTAFTSATFHAVTSVHLHPLDPSLAPVDMNSSLHIEFESPGWKPISAAAKDLIRRMLCINPAQRLSSLEVLEHPWLNQRSELELISLVYNTQEVHWTERLSWFLKFPGHTSLDLTITSLMDLKILNRLLASSADSLTSMCLSFEFSAARIITVSFEQQRLNLRFSLPPSLKAFSATAAELDVNCTCSSPLALDSLTLIGRTQLLVSSLPLASANTVYLNGPTTLKQSSSPWEDLFDRTSVSQRCLAATEASLTQLLSSIAPTVEVLTVKHGMPLENVSAEWSRLRRLSIGVNGSRRSHGGRHTTALDDAEFLSLSRRGFVQGEESGSGSEDEASSPPFINAPKLHSIFFATQEWHLGTLVSLRRHFPSLSLYCIVGRSFRWEREGERRKTEPVMQRKDVVNLLPCRVWHIIFRHLLDNPDDPWAAWPWGAGSASYEENTRRLGASWPLASPLARSRPMRTCSRSRTCDRAHAQH